MPYRQFCSHIVSRQVLEWMYTNKVYRHIGKFCSNIVARQVIEWIYDYGLTPHRPFFTYTMADSIMLRGNLAESRASKTSAVCLQTFPRTYRDRKPAGLGERWMLFTWNLSLFQQNHFPGLPYTCMTMLLDVTLEIYKWKLRNGASFSHCPPLYWITTKR